MAMDDRQLEGALERLERALGKAEALAAGQGAKLAEASAKDARLAALEKRHGELKHAVAGALGQIDQMLAGMAK